MKNIGCILCCNCQWDQGSACKAHIVRKKVSNHEAGGVKQARVGHRAGVGLPIGCSGLPNLVCLPARLHKVGEWPPRQIPATQKGLNEGDQKSDSHSETQEWGKQSFWNQCKEGPHQDFALPINPFAILTTNPNLSTIRHQGADASAQKACKTLVCPDCQQQLGPEESSTCTGLLHTNEFCCFIEDSLNA